MPGQGDNVHGGPGARRPVYMLFHAGAARAQIVIVGEILRQLLSKATTIAMLVNATIAMLVNRELACLIRK